MAAGTVTLTEELLHNVKKITFAWTAGTGGDAGTATKQTSNVYAGNILKVVTVPGTGGTQPTDNYDITLTDEDSIDVCNGQLANRDDTNTEWVASSLGAVAGDKLTFNLTNAGSGKTGTCVVYIGYADTADVDTDIENALYGTAGITSWPAGAAPGDGVSIAEALREVYDEVVEVEGHFHTRARWFGKKAVQTATDWADDTIATTFRVISGNNAYGSDANDEAQVFGTADIVVSGQTKFDMDKIMVVASSITSAWKLRIVYGTGTLADAVSAGQYSETMVQVASASSRITKEDIRMPRLTVGTHKVWMQGWSGTDNATLDFYVGIHGYVS